MSDKRRAAFVFGGLGCLALVLVLVAVFKSSPKPERASPEVPVDVAQVSVSDVPEQIQALGAAQAWRSDVIVAQVSGVIEKVDFTEGAPVKAGQVLAEIDPAPYRAALLQAQGVLKRDQAALDTAKRDLARYKSLAATDSIARQTYEDQMGLVQQDEGIVMADQGAVAAARVNLDRCHITSPISGRAGVRLIDPGNVVGGGGVSASTNGASATGSPVSAGAAGGANPGAGAMGSVTGGVTGSSGIVVINQITPIAVTFTVPQSDFAHLAQVTDGLRRALKVAAFTQETNQPLGEGLVSIADNKVDPATGTVQLKAKFDNADEKLWPGQYVNVVLTLDTLRHATTIPVTAVNKGPKGAFVYVVAGATAQYRPVTIRSTQGPLAIIGDGLKAGETVVVDGQMILKPGSKVRIKANGGVTAPTGRA